MESIDWACQKEIIDTIDEAEEVTGCWQFTPEAFAQSQLREDQLLFECSGVIGSKVKNDQLVNFKCYSEDILRISDLSFLDQEFDVLFISAQHMGIPLLEDLNTSILIQKDYSEISITITRFHDEDTWTLARTFQTFSKMLMRQLDKTNFFNGEIRGEKRIGSFQIQAFYSPNSVETIKEILGETRQQLTTIIEDTYLALSRGPVWKKVYEEKEDPFCREVLEPLLRKLGYEYVRYIGGPREGGKDFVFSRRTRFGDLEHYGLQAKAGDMSGAVNSRIDTIVGQIEDAFTLPYQEPGSEKERYISIFIVATSGHFTPQARKKIVKKMPNWAKGSVYFWDKARIHSLISLVWSED